MIELGSPGKVKARGDDAAIERWLPKLREHKPAILTALRLASEPATDPDPGAAVEDALKGHAVLVVLDADGARVWLVADAEDAGKLGSVGTDAIVTRDEIRILAATREPEVRAELMAFKRELKGMFTAL